MFGAITRTPVRRSRLSLLLVPALVIGLLTLFGAGAASAATPLGGLTLNPASGTSTTPISMTTVSTGASKGCPSGASNVVGFVTGPAPWTDILVANNSSAGVSNSDDFSIDVVDTFAGIATSNNLSIVAGKYTITVYCQNSLGTNRPGEFSTSLWFTSPTAYQSTDPNAPVVVTTTTTLSTTPASTATAGTPVSLTATVSPATAAGTVQFTDTVGAATVNIGSPVAVSGGTASASATTLAAGSHSLKAVFTPASAAAFTSSTSAARAFTVTPLVTPPASTTTALSANPVSGAKAGDSVTLLASVLPLAAAGTIQITDTIGGTTSNVGTPVTVSGGSASLTTTALSAATHSLTAVFTPASAADYAPSSSSALSYVVAAAPVPPATTTTALAVNPSGSAGLGTPVTLRATLTPVAAAGSVQFKDGSTNLGSPVAVSAGAAELSTSSLAAGAHSLVAVFIPADAGAYAGSQSAAASFTVTTKTPPAATSVTLAANPASPSELGAAVTFTATITPAAAAGTVTFSDAGATAPIGSTAVSDGKATETTSTLPAGSHSITATFVPGDPSAYTGSASSVLPYTVTAPPNQPVSTSTTLSASPNGSAATGAPVTLTAAVSPVAAAGTVQFTDTVAGTTTPLGAATTIKDGKAVLATAFTVAGDHQFGAAFTPADPAAYTASTAKALAYQVTAVQNPQAKPTSTNLYGWPTWFCPPALTWPMQNWNWLQHFRFNCRGAVLVARVTPGTAAGDITFTDTTGSGPVKQLGATVIVQGGFALTFITLTPGKHTYAAVFTPKQPDRFQPSASNEIRVSI